MYQSDHNGVTHIYLQQAHQGIRVYNAYVGEWHGTQFDRSPSRERGRGLPRFHPHRSPHRPRKCGWRRTFRPL
ncbi:MAG: hypothetical protein IPL78_11685 [Chloroflexi bacterium]|nr:hypothetical protein [Chloroflexota bacterium]